jgi:hypothetical protein
MTMTLSGLPFTSRRVHGAKGFHRFDLVCVKYHPEDRIRFFKEDRRSAKSAWNLHVQFVCGCRSAGPLRIEKGPGHVTLEVSRPQREHPVAMIVVSKLWGAGYPNVQTCIPG